MNTGSRDEQIYLANIARIADALNRLANCAEAAEQRRREADREFRESLEEPS